MNRGKIIKTKRKRKRPQIPVEDLLNKQKLITSQSSKAHQLLVANYVPTNQPIKIPMPRILKSDIRRSYIQQFINVFNSCDYNNMISYANKYFSPDFKCCQITRSSTNGVNVSRDDIATSRSLNGLHNILNFWYQRMIEAPDILFTMTNWKIKVRSDGTSTISGDFVLSGTKLLPIALFKRPSASASHGFMTAVPPSRLCSNDYDMMLSILKTLDDEDNYSSPQSETSYPITQSSSSADLSSSSTLPAVSKPTFIEDERAIASIDESENPPHTDSENDISIADPIRMNDMEAAKIGGEIFIEKEYAPYFEKNYSELERRAQITIHRMFGNSFDPSMLYDPFMPPIIAGGLPFPIPKPDVVRYGPTRPDLFATSLLMPMRMYPNGTITLTINENLQMAGLHLTVRPMFTPLPLESFE